MFTGPWCGCGGGFGFGFGFGGFDGEDGDAWCGRWRWGWGRWCREGWMRGALEEDGMMDGWIGREWAGGRFELLDVRAGRMER